MIINGFFGIFSIFNGRILVGIIYFLIFLSGILLCYFSGNVKIYEVRRGLFIKWKRKIKELGYVEMIRESQHIAVEIYKTHPGKMAYKYIKKLNPNACNVIQSINPDILIKKLSDYDFKKENTFLKSILQILSVLLIFFSFILCLITLFNESLLFFFIFNIWDNRNNTSYFC